MSGVRAATARMEVSAENLANQQTRGVLPGQDATPPLKPNTTPIPKVYRPTKVNLYSLDQTGGGVGVQYRQVTPGYYATYDPTAAYADQDGMVAAPAVDPASEVVEQIQASVHYRASLKAMQRLQDAEDSVLDIIA